MKKILFNVQGMTCSACQSHVQSAVEKLSGIESVNVNLLQNNMIVQFNEIICNENIIIDAVKKAGYLATIPNKNQEKTSSQVKSKKNNSIKNEIYLLIASFVFLFLLMYFSMGNMMWGFKTFKIFDHKHNPVGFALIQLILLIPILIINRKYFINGFKRLFKLKPNMDSLIAVGSSISAIYSIICIFIISYAQSKISMIASGQINGLQSYTYYSEIIHRYISNLYFESAGMILTLVSFGKLLEKISLSKTTNSITSLLNLAPKTAIVLTDGDVEKEIPASDVKIDDIVVVKKGYLVPIDGVIISGKASINEANITGESLPVFKQSGDNVYSSTIIESGYLKIKATKVGEDTTFSNIIKLVEEASNSKAPISKLADKISGVFVPIIFAIATLTFFINFASHQSLELSLNFAITTIVIACPCALGLATPVAIMVGTGKGAENGLLIRNAEIMEKAHHIKTIVFDKTGTITEGSPTVTNFEIINSDNNSRVNNQEIVDIIYALENQSEHPLAKAIIDYLGSQVVNKINIQNYKSIDGFGIVGEYNNSTYYIGNINYLKEQKINYDNFIDKNNNHSLKAEIPLIMLKNNKICAFLTLKDNIKNNSKETIQLLKQMKINTIMLTGDNKTTSEIIAKEVGVDEVISEVKPKDKQDVINRLKQKYLNEKNHIIAMVGDGVNDAPALKTADIGISIGSGSDIAIETSDIVLIKNDLLDVVNVISLSRKVFSTIKLGLFWAFFYNFICVIIATGIFYKPFNLIINPMIGSIAMSISSVSVVLNALTINLFKPHKSKNKEQENQSLDLSSQTNTNSSCNLNSCKLAIPTTNDKINNTANDIANNKKPNNITLEKGEINMNTIEFYVKGMMCQNCERHVRKALEEAGASEIVIDLTTKKVTANSDLSKEEIFNLITNAGYEPTDD